MRDRTTGVLTGLLRRSAAGDARAADDLFRLAYDDLRAVAGARMKGERDGHTLQPTALVHELFLKLAGGSIAARDRGHFVGIAARAMRQILVDHARRKVADKRGGGASRTTLGEGHLTVDVDPGRLVDLDRAMESLEERQRTVVELRFFAGLEEREVAELLGVTERTVRRDWVKARAWLHAALEQGEKAGSGPVAARERETPARRGTRAA